MQIHDLPYPDPGVPDARSGPRFLWWLFRNQLGGQLKALAWGLLHFTSVASLPFCVGVAVQAAVDRSGGRLALAGALLAVVARASRSATPSCTAPPSPTGSPPPPGCSNCWAARPPCWAPR